jgi:eukaryotic-like serine/threonine-protein kinase
VTDYEVDGVTGHGLVGPLHAARYLPTGLTVTVEDIPSSLARDDAFTQRLASIGRVAASFRHPGAVAVFNLLDDGGRLRLVTELDDGVPLAALPPGHAALSPADALSIADGVLDVLGAAHAEGLVHGGVTRGAVLITRAGEVRVRGFALAAALHPDRAADATNDLADTAVLTASLLGISLDDRALRLPQLRAVRNVLRRAAAADPSHRYRSAATMRRALDAAATRSLGMDWREGAALAGLVRSAAPSPAPPAPVHRKPAPRVKGPAARRRVVVAAAAVALGIVAGLVATAARGAQPPPATPVQLAGPLTLTVTPAEGGCDTSFTIRASAPVRGAGSIVYRWERSDGGVTAKTPLQVTTADASIAVTQSWYVSGPESPPWIAFQVVSPAPARRAVTLDYACS